MTVYVMADVKVTDDSWLPDYLVNVQDIIHKHGGKFLSRSKNISTIEGEGLDSSMFVLLEFQSMEALQAFADDPEYAPYRQARQAGSTSLEQYPIGRNLRLPPDGILLYFPTARAALSDKWIAKGDSI